jgi:sulfite exporter TauE/SafE
MTVAGHNNATIRMNMELTLPAAFLVGLLGGVHCVGMCSGIVGVLTGSLAPAIRESRWRFLLAVLAYNSGRIASYTLAGLLLGLLGQQVSALGVLASWPVGRIVAGVFMILFGLYLAGWWQVLRILEKAGSRVWRYIEPYGRRFIPVQGAAQAFMLGAIWGWLPCGMVYAVLAMALASSSVLHGGLIMLTFGLGTLPLMVTMGYTFGSLNRVLQAPAIRTIAGVTVILFGLYAIVSAPAAHERHQQHGTSGHAHHPAPATMP